MMKQSKSNEKRYKLRLSAPLLSDREWVYYNKNTLTGSGVLGSPFGSRPWKTTFTESEISHMDITGFEKIEVTP